MQASCRQAALPAHVHASALALGAVQLKEAVGMLGGFGKFLVPNPPFASSNEKHFQPCPVLKSETQILYRK